MHNEQRRRLLQHGLAAGATALTPAWAKNERRSAPAPAPATVFLNDASRMNRTPVDHHRVLKSGFDDAAWIEALRAELARAAATGRPVTVGAARHSMGGQSLPAQGVAITFENATCRPDPARRVYLAHAGARWHQIIKTLDPIGYSPAVMQSNSDFGLAGTLSVNAHGWPAPFGPFGETVNRFRLMLADGSIVNCSRDENKELFALAVGGYGLVGIVLDAEVQMVENPLLEPLPELMPSSRFAERMVGHLEQDVRVKMAYGRLSLAREHFFDEALLVTYRPVVSADGRIPRLKAGGGLTGAVSREIFRAQIGSEKMKKTRWSLERRHKPGRATRNTLMNEPVANLAGRDRTRADILHEYFVPPERFAEFVAACRDVIPGSGQELLNVTLRYLAPDTTSVLAYAPQRRIAAVMLFSQKIDPSDDASMHRMTEALIDRVLALGGSFYLPYRLHARRDQIERAYPRLAEFIARKHHYDAKGVFRNLMWMRYFA